MRRGLLWHCVHSRGVVCLDAYCACTCWQTEQLNKHEGQRSSDRSELVRNLKVREREIESMLQVSSRPCHARDARSAVLRVCFESIWFCQRRLAPVCQEFVVWALA